jgi:acyl dehydratase
MPATIIAGISGLQALVGQTLGPTEWRVITQDQVNAFAAITGDRQWIHVDVERAQRESPFGTTIAHGNLTLSLIDGFRDELTKTTGFVLGVNYGWNRVRFPAPVPTGSRVRATMAIKSVEPLAARWWHVTQHWVVEVESQRKPACVAESVGRVLAE